MSHIRLLTFVTKILCLFVLMVFTVVNSASVFALSDEQKKLYNQNILYYDLGCSPAQEQEDSGGEVSGSVQEMAKQMLDNKNITYWTNLGVNTRDVVVALSKGQKAYTTAANAPNKTADINPAILQFILEVAKSDHIMVNALTDKTHSNGSNHYKGLAVDLDLTSAPLSVLDPAAKKYGGVKNTETSHHHYDFLKRLKVDDESSGDTAGNIKSVYMRGDSITYGADKFYDLEGKFKDKGINATATGSGGGTVSRPGTTGDQLSGLDAMDKDKDKVKDVDAVVVAYGTNNYNESASAMRSEIKKMVQKIRSINRGAQIFWVNIKIKDSGDMKKINNVIDEMSSSQNYTVIDYGSSDIPLGDDFHPAYSEKGFGAWGELVADGVAKGASNTDDSPLQTGAACCGDSENVESGKGTPEGTLFPNLDPASMADAINDFIKKTNPNSKLSGLGETIVAGAEHSNISPFLIVAHAHAESNLADPSMYNIVHGNNAFGRTATSSQPNFQGARLWYKWSSVKASVDYTAPENKGAVGGGDIASYIREQYSDVIDKGDLDSYLLQYVADGSEGAYGQMVRDDMSAMASASEKGSSSEGTSSTESSGGTACCPSGGTIPGDSNKAKIWNYFIGKGLSPQAVAGIMGNIAQESGYNPKQHQIGGPAYGLIQWDPSAGISLEDWLNQANIHGDKWALETQLELIWWHMADGTPPPGGDFDIGKFKKMDDIEQATIYFEENIEAAGDPQMADRFSEANRVFEEFKDSSSGKTSSTSGGCGSATSANCEQPSGTPKDVIDKVVLPLAKELGFDDTPESVAGANAGHSTNTVSGNVSDHSGPPERAWAADISNGSSPTPEMDELAKKISECFDIPWSGSGGSSSTSNGYRYQLIYRTPEGSEYGNHMDHVHIGIAAE